MRLPFKGLFIFTQDFGANPPNYAKFLVLYPDGIRRPMQGHNGLDFACPTRTEIIAPHSGHIIEATFDSAGYGYYVKIESDIEGSVLAHLDSIDVRVDYQVLEGDHIGWSDNTGNSTGPHCHWGYYTMPRDRSNGFAGFIDQKPFLQQYGIELIVGQLPEVAVVMKPVMAGVYGGLDLSNEDSVKAAIDAWHDVANGKYIPASEYQDVKTQLATVKEQLLEIQRNDEGQLVKLKNYNEMAALEYTTIDDIKAALNSKDIINLKLEKENATIRQRNSVLAGEISKMEIEDHTTAALGQQRIDENELLRNTIEEVARVAGADKPTLTSIADKIFNWRQLADSFVKRLEEEHRKLIKPQPVTSLQLPQPVANGFDKLLTLFQFTEEKEVNQLEK